MSVGACSASYLRWWLLKALLFLAAVLPTSGDCPKLCVCNVPTEMHCTFRYLTTIPDPIQPAVKRINLGYNSISALKENDLSGLENLELLMLQSNTIQSIDDRTFQDLKSLQVLKMSFNKVKKINKGTFKGLDSLLRLFFDNNHIEFISPEAFYGLTNLQLVHLEGNNLQQLHPDTFITLRHSQVFKVSSVRNIHLSDNLLTSLPVDIFSGCSQLENLFLHGNPWTCDCRMRWFSVWAQRNTGVLKCKRDRKYPSGQVCPVCHSPVPFHNRTLSLFPSDAFNCTKPWIQPHLKQKNISLDEDHFTPVSPKDFIAPLGSIQMNLTDHFHNSASLSCSVQRPTAFENLTQTFQKEEGNNVTLLTASIITYLVCNVDNDLIEQLWQILATYSDSPMRLERGLMLARSPEMVYKYSQVKTKEAEEGFYTNIEAEIKASPAWLMQGEVSFQLDRTATTYSTLHIKYQTVAKLRVENTSPKRDHYSWTLIKRDNQTKTEHTVLTGGVAQLNCQIQGEPKPLLEWILPDGSKVRAPYSSEDRRIIISAEGKLIVRGADSSDTGVYRCITTNFLDADILTFRVTVLSPDVEEDEVNGVQLSRPLGENVFFDCSSLGSPEASVQWILPDHSVLDKSYGNKKVYENGTLLIQDLTPKDRGFYRCLVANHLGVDLLVSYLTVIDEKSETLTTLDNEGSGIGEKIDPILTENRVNLIEIPSPSSSDRTSQESRPITSDPPYLALPRLRSRGRGVAGGRLGQKRRGPLINRRLWSSSAFDKATRKVDPEKFARFVKKAQNRSRLKTGTENERIKSAVSDTDLSGDGEFGSGEDHNKDNLIIASKKVKPMTDYPQKGVIFGQEERQPKTKITTQAVSNPIDLSQVQENKNTPTTEPNVRSDSTPIKSTFTNSPTEQSRREEVTPYSFISYDSSLSNRPPATLQLTVSDSSLETLAEPETSTWSALSFTTDPNVTPMRDDSGPVELVIHPSTDSESQKTFTAITTTERQQNEITFHTTQTIESPGLPAGSTFISQQHIHIIPHKNSRGGGRRRTFQGRRRIIKPSRITDIQSFINKLKQPSMKKKENATGSCNLELTKDCCCNEDKKKSATTDVQVLKPSVSSRSSLHQTEQPNATGKTTPSPTSYYITSAVPVKQTESRPEGSRSYITSADVSKFDPAIDQFLNTHKEPPTFTTAITTTTASKVVRGRIPWNRLFGGQEKKRILDKLKRPYITKKVATTTTDEATTAILTTTPAAMPSNTTASSLDEPKILSPFRLTRNNEGSLDDDYEHVSSANFEFTTLGPRFHHLITTNSLYYSGSSTTAETPPESKTLPSPNTVKLPTAENPDDAFFSGSGELSNNWRVVRQRLGWTIGQQGRKRRPFRGRRPFNGPAITELRRIKTNKVPSAEERTMETGMEKATLSHGAVSLLKSLHTPSRKGGRKTIVTSKGKEEIDLYEFNWSKSSTLPAFTTAETPLVPSTTLTPTTTLMLTTTKRPYRTVWIRGHNIRPPTQSNNGHNTHRQPVRRVRPTVQSNGSQDTADKCLIFDTKAILTMEQGYTSTSAPYSNIDTNKAISSVYDHVTGIKAASPSLDDFEPTTKAMTSKPKIVGGNAASFTVLSNSDAYLPCETVGNPKPAINWKRFSITGSPITIKGKMGKFEVLSNGTLSILNANIKDRGQYLCLAENDHGSAKLLVTLSVVAYPPRILEPKLREDKSLAGNTVKMKCKAEGRPMPMISWILANQTQIRGQHTEKGRVSVTAEGTLVIEHVSVYDQGHYKCIASNPAGADTATVQLQVVAAPPGIMQEKRQQVKAHVGQNLWLHCTGQGSPRPKIHWVLHDGSMLQSNGPYRNTRTSVHENGTLHIKDVTPEDSGKYECIATSSTGSERRLVIVTVERQGSAPRILETSQRMTELFFGDQLRLNCSATGDPKPRILWRLPSKAVVDQWHRMGSRIQVLDNGTLIVSTVSDKDAGDYLCVARSKIGDDLKFMRVSVSMKPAKIEPKLDGKKQVAYGNDVKVDCKASGAPKPEISWSLPDGTVVSTALQSDVSSGGGRVRRYTLYDNGTLYLNEVGIAEGGDYTCYAENPVGKDEMIVHISVVTTAPRIHPTSQTYAQVKPGGNFRFDCEAIGEPKPKILWILPTNDVITASNERYSIHVNGSLDIRDVKVFDAGEYFCMARNPAGESKKGYKLDIDGNPPVINGHQQNRTVIKDLALKFTRKLIDCEAKGNPEPSITWIMPDNIFLTAPYFGSRINVHHNGTLEIRNVRPTDTAEYICMARNDGGEAVMVVQLEVASMLRRPIFKNPFNERILSQNRKTTVLSCSADGHPVPEIIWTLPNGTRFTGKHEQGSHYHIGSNGSFVIYSPRKEDAGKYRCGARNFMGYIEKIIILDVGRKPYILTRPRGIIRSVAGDPLFLHCLTDGSPRPRIYWTIPGGRIINQPQVRGRYQLLENGTLVVQATTLHDRGNYICRAYNDAGEAMLTVPVVIIAYPPRIKTGPPPNVKAVTGKPIQLICAATGIPKPEITWELPDHSVLSVADQGRHMGSKLLHPQGTLIIQRPSYSDSGTYKCLAKNHLGKDSKVTYVDVL